MSVDVTIIGAGNLAWHLAPALDNAGYAVREVYSRNPKNAKSLMANLYQAEVCESLDFSNSNSSIFIIAVADDAIEDIVQEIVLPESAIVVHTSGAKSIGVLSYTAVDAIGVFYPLQTFSKGKKIDFEGIPICIEAEDPKTENLLKKMATAISKTVYVVNSLDRKSLHVAAVFACNFANHCLAIAEQLLNQKKLPFDMLKPLIIETINKSLALGPYNAQTGPAKRHDFETLDAHMAYLESNEALSEIYRLFSQNIVDNHPLT